MAVLTPIIISGREDCRADSKAIGDHRVILDPDQQVQENVRLVFENFRRQGSAFAVVEMFRRQGLLFPRHRRRGPDHEAFVWKQLSYSLLMRILHNPRSPVLLSTVARKAEKACTARPRRRGAYPSINGRSCCEERILATSVGSNLRPTKPGFNRTGPPAPAPMGRVRHAKGLRSCRA
jgi:hypothetical protein